VLPLHWGGAALALAYQQRQTPEGKEAMEAAAALAAASADVQTAINAAVDVGIGLQDLLGILGETFKVTLEAEEESEEEEEGTEAEFEESEEEEDTAGSSVAGPSSSAPPPSARRRKPSDQVTRSATIRGRTVACDAICGGQGQFLAHIAAHLTKHPDDGIQTDKCCPHWL